MNRWLCFSLCILLDLSYSQSLVNTLQCHNRREISPCTCRYKVPEYRSVAYALQCNGVESFSSIITALTAQFDQTKEIALTISQSNLEDLSTMSFATLNMSIYRLNLSLNNLRDVPQVVFEGLETVESLNLAENPLPAVPSHILPFMPKLRVLDLKSCNISTILKEDFESLSMLQFAALGGNQISVLEKESLPNTITKIQLSNNNLTTLNSTLRGMSDLQWLWVNGNQLKSLEGELPDAEELELAHLSADQNELEAIPSDLRRCPKLGFLRLDSNQIRSLDGHLSFARKLEYLYLYDNLLTSLASDDFTYAENILELDIAWNLLQTLNGSLLPLKNLYSLNLSHNNMTVFDFKDIMGMKHLHKVDLSYNGISNLVSRTENMVGHELTVVTLLLNNNHLETLGGALQNIASLKHLNLSNNYLQTISPDDFIGLDALKLLDISHNRLATLEEISKRILPSLDELYATHNEITSLENDFHGLPRLCWAYLNHNKIETISTHLVEQTKCAMYTVPTALRIYLHGNPVLCRVSELDKLIQMEVNNSYLLDFSADHQDCQTSLEPEISHHPFFKENKDGRLRDWNP